MKKNHFPWLSYAITGTGIGFPVAVLCSLLIGGYNEYIGELLIWMVASVLFGLASGLFFEKLNLNMIVASVSHFVCCLLIASTAGWLCGYAGSFLELLGGMLPMFVLVYAAVYLVIYFSMKQEAEKINRTLEEQ